MMNNKEQYIKRLHQFVVNYGNEYGIKRIGIFGSVARGADNEQSDIDIFYEGKPNTLLDGKDLKTHLENYLQRPIDLIRNHKYINPVLLNHIRQEIIYV
jgi:predicted nucleotidyltransferase